MRRRVRTMVVAEFAVIAFFFDSLVVSRGDFGDVAFVSVNFFKERIERRTEIKTATASIADIKNAIGLLLKLRTSPICRDKMNAFQFLNLKV